jgi:hypothetical protein
MMMMMRRRRRRRRSLDDLPRLAAALGGLGGMHRQYS